jgi:hypothetical protein
MMQPSPPPQLPQYPVPPPGTAPPPYYLPPPMPPRKSRTALIVLVAVILVVVGVSAAVYILASHTVHVTAENISITGATNCWTSTTGSGETVAGGSTFTTTWTLAYTAGPVDPASRTVQSVSIGTPGFALASANVPLLVLDGGNQTLTMRIVAPNSDYTGTLSLILAVTSP